MEVLRCGGARGERGNVTRLCEDARGDACGVETMSMLLYITGRCCRSKPIMRKSADDGAMVQGQARLANLSSSAHCLLSTSNCSR